MKILRNLLPPFAAYTGAALLLSCGGSQGSTAVAANNGVVGTTTSPGDPKSLILALKWVSFSDVNGKPITTQEDAAKDLATINHLYVQCGVRFEIESYQVVIPDQLNLPYGLETMNQLDTIRTPFDEPNRLVVITTGAWAHGSMGPANAWTVMPGLSPAGAVIEGPVAKDGNIIAHELGHYLNLDHVNDKPNLMNPVIYSYSTVLNSDQCQQVRDATGSSRKTALR